MITRGAVLPIEDRVIELMNSDEIATIAKELSVHAKKNGRSQQEVFENSVPSLAIEHAALEYFAKTLNSKFEWPAPNVFHYDGKLNGVLVDVKTRFGGRYWQQTPWEVKTIADTGDKVLYICIDLLPAAYKFMGCIWGSDLLPSQHGSPYAVADIMKELPNPIQG